MKTGQTLDPQVMGAPTTSIIALHRRIEELEAENAALREDKARLDWAEENTLTLSTIALGHGRSHITPIRAAIDAAKGGSHG